MNPALPCIEEEEDIQIGGDPKDAASRSAGRESEEEGEEDDDTDSARARGGGGNNTG